MQKESVPSAARASKPHLKLVLCLTGFMLVVEVVGGILTHSLALLADAGHMLTDLGGLVLALVAISFAERPATPERTYGYYRVEILAALTNAVVLIGVSFFVLYEAWERFRNPPKVQSGLMLAVASVGLVVNLIGIRLLRKGSRESLNLKGAYFEVLADMLTSVGVLVASAVMLTTGWYLADPLISAAIGLFILPRTWILLRDAVGVLLEGTPSDVDLAAIRESLRGIPGVSDVHDLHGWALTSGVNAASAHVVVEDDRLHDQVLLAAHGRLAECHRIAHSTIQIENVGWPACESHL